MFTEFINLIFPNRCRSCEKNLFKGEYLICTFCRFKLPRTNFHQIPDNPLVKHFWGKTQITNAAAYFYFNKGSRVQHLIHLLKYKGEKDLGVLLGNLFGSVLHTAENFRTIDYLIPVPLHASRRKQRGYNQSEIIVDGMHETMHVPAIKNLLIRERATATQTRKKRYSRYENMKEVFVINNNSKYEGKHFLLVDDVITTGSTLVACAEKLHEIKNVKVSVAAIAYAHH